MNEQDRSELQSLKQRQLLLVDRLKVFGEQLAARESQLDFTRRELEGLKQQQRSLLEQRNLLAQSLAALETRLASAAAAEPLPFTQIQPLQITTLEPVELKSHFDVTRPEPLQMVPSSEARKTPPPLPPLPQPVPPVLPESTHAAAPISWEIPANERPLTSAETTVPSFNTPPHVGSPSISAGLPPISSVEPDRPAKSSFEMRLGTYWLVRIGIVMLLTGMVFLGGYAYKNVIGKLGPGGKITLLYLLSGTLLGVGAWLHRKQESLRNYSQVLVAGGLAAVYFTTYAAHHIVNLRVIQSPLVDGALLLAWAGFMVWLADRIKSEVLALFAIGLGYYTSVMTQVGFFTLYSNFVLTLAAVFFLVRNRWATLSLISLAATYGGYGFWRFYHHGDWQWASPSEGLWSGTYFLISYWALFTAAVFLSRHEHFAGRKRAGFLSLNNGAFFTLFILTMLQVRQGGFWKFSLGYGTVLLALAGLARHWFREERVVRNAYLTQGLLLLTLGFITYFKGFNLALVLAVESVALTILGRQLENRVLRVGSYIVATLAVAWEVSVTKRFDSAGLYGGAIIGALALFNSFWGQARQDKADFKNIPFRPAFFTVLGLLMWLITTWMNATPLWRGLVLAGEGALFLIAGRLAKHPVLPFGGYPFAALGAGCGMFMMFDPFHAFDVSRRVGLYQEVMIGGLLMISALWERPRSSQTGTGQFHPPVIFFSALALAIWLGATWVFTPPAYLAPLLAAEALLFTASYHLLRLGEVTLFGQLFLIVAQLQCIEHLLYRQSLLPWWNPAVVIAVTVAISHWWQRQQSLRPAKEMKQLGDVLYALAAVAVLFCWLKPQVGAPAWLGLTSLLAVAVTAYGAATRAWFLAAAGQLLVCASALEFFRQLYGRPDIVSPPWFYALAPIITLSGLALCALKWLEFHAETKDRIGAEIHAVSLVYRGLALVLSLGWIFEYVGSRERFWVLVLVGGLLFLWNGVKQSKETLLMGAVFTAVALARFWLQFNDPALVYWPNLLAILCLLAQQQVARRLATRFVLGEEIHTSAILLGTGSAWLYFSRWVIESSQGMHSYLTAVWAALALVIFAAGFVLRERIYRWSGLTVLACALGRVALSDIWRLELIYRILSFMALGVVLLVLGFIYNKYQEKIREWL